MTKTDSRPTQSDSIWSTPQIQQCEYLNKQPRQWWKASERRRRDGALKRPSRPQTWNSETASAFPRLTFWARLDTVVIAELLLRRLATHTQVAHTFALAVIKKNKYIKAWPVSKSVNRSLRQSSNGPSAPILSSFNQRWLSRPLN